jgi:hypothetical protein
MHMRSTWIVRTVAVLGSLLSAAMAAHAQPTGNFNYDRAYAHFLNSRYSYRQMYSPIPGSSSVSVGPLGYQSQFVESGFIRQRISPLGYERYDAVPGHGGMTLMPFGMSSYYVPGYGVYSYRPFPR